MSDNNTYRPVAGGNARAPKRIHGRGWLLKRARNGLTWKQRKMRSHRYCATPVATRT